MSSNVWTTRTIPPGTNQSGNQWSSSNTTATIWWLCSLICGKPWHHFSVRIWPTSSQLRKFRASNPRTMGISSRSTMILVCRCLSRVAKWKRISSSPMAFPCSAKRSRRVFNSMHVWECGMSLATDGKAGKSKREGADSWASFSSDFHSHSVLSSSLFPEAQSQGRLTSSSCWTETRKTSLKTQWTAQTCAYAVAIGTPSNLCLRKSMALAPQAE